MDVKTLLAIVCVIFVVFMNIRRPNPGQETSGVSALPPLSSISEFDKLHPKASSRIRKYFHRGYIAQRKGQVSKAKLYYQKILDEFDSDEPCTCHNMQLLDR